MSDNLMIASSKLVSAPIFFGNNSTKHLTVQSISDKEADFDELFQGSIEPVEIINGVSTLIFNIKCKNDIEIEIHGLPSNRIELLFCLEGNIAFSNGHGKEKKAVGFRQNVVVKRNKNSDSIIHVAKDVELQMSYSFLDGEELGAGNLNIASLSALFKEVTENVAVGSIYYHFGRVCGRTADFARSVFDLEVIGTKHQIYQRAAIMNVLASQLEREYTDTIESDLNAPISRYELDKVIATMTFIEDNLSENLQIDRLNRVSGLSPSKLQAGFRYLYDKSVANYITNARIEKAAELLQNTDMNISETVYEVGLSSRSYFSKKFLIRYGISPSMLKKKYATQPSLA